MTIFIVDCIYRVFELANSVIKYFRVKARLQFVWTNSDIYNGTTESFQMSWFSKTHREADRQSCLQGV